MNDTLEALTRTYNLLEDLAKKGVIKVTINKPPPEHLTCKLPGIYALVPRGIKRNQIYPSDALWDTIRKHGGHTCGNGLGWTQDKKYYWVQSQVNEEFFTGSYEWIGKDMKNYRLWDSQEVLDIILDI